MKKKTTDPLLALAGTLRFDISDIEPMPNPPLSKDSQDPEDAEKQDEEEMDLLRALAGTWKCGIPDLGERHDDYIADALIAELWGDADE